MALLLLIAELTCNWPKRHEIGIEILSGGGFFALLVGVHLSLFRAFGSDAADGGACSEF